MTVSAPSRSANWASQGSASNPMEAASTTASPDEILYNRRPLDNFVFAILPRFFFKPAPDRARQGKGSGSAPVLAATHARLLQSAAARIAPTLKAGPAACVQTGVRQAHLPDSGSRSKASAAIRHNDGQRG